MESNSRCREVHFGETVEDERDVRANAAMAAADVIGRLVAEQIGADR